VVAVLRKAAGPNPWGRGLEWQTPSPLRHLISKGPVVTQEAYAYDTELEGTVSEHSSQSLTNSTTPRSSTRPHAGHVAFLITEIMFFGGSSRVLVYILGHSRVRRGSGTSTSPRDRQHAGLLAAASHGTRRAQRQRGPSGQVLF